MIIFKDKLTGDEMISDNYELNEICDGFFYEVEGKWITKQDAEVDIGANPSAEGGDDEGVEAVVQKVVDIVDGFRLNEQPPYTKKEFLGFIKGWLAKVKATMPTATAEDKEYIASFEAASMTGVKFLMAMVKDLQLFLGESMDIEGSPAFAYYKEGAAEPTFLFPKFALKEEKV